MLIILAIVGGIGWFIYKRAQDGSFDDISNQIQKLVEEADKDEALEAIEEYLSEKYDDHCTYSGSAMVKLPDGAVGGLFRCKAVNDMSVYAYATESDDEYVFEDGYLFAKHFSATESSIATAVRLYFPGGKVSLINSNYGISTNVDKTLPFFKFVKENNYKYAFRLDIPSGTGININNLTAMARQLSGIIPNFQLDGIYTNENNDESNTTQHVFMIRCENGKASVVVDQ